jgi:SpoVK/Ycf46/Vps4 family AAA+-type ATPase
LNKTISLPLLLASLLGISSLGFAQTVIEEDLHEKVFGKKRASEIIDIDFYSENISLGPVKVKIRGDKLISIDKASLLIVLQEKLEPAELQKIASIKDGWVLPEELGFTVRYSPEILGLIGTIPLNKLTPQEKPIDDSIFSENKSTKDIILHSIHKFVNEELLMVVAANNLVGIDNEVFAPGRFDIKIPIFPPNEDERAQMIMQYITLNLSEDAILMKILKHNGADKKPYWSEYAKRMKLFSNTMMIDFTQSVKKRLRNVYLRKKTHECKIEKSILEASFIECASKLTDEYLNEVQQFIREVSANDYDVFAARIEAMKKEFQAYIIKEKPHRKIGFNVED